MKQPILVAVSNQKGGVGKSTLTALIASMLHYEKDYHVAVVDCDTHQHSLAHMRARDRQSAEKSDSYKQLLMERLANRGKKLYPIVESSPREARSCMDELAESHPELDIILADLPGSVESDGVFATIVNMDYVLTPIVADRMVMQSTLAFSTSVIDALKGREDVPLKKFLFLWNKVDKRVSPEVFEAYAAIMKRLELHVLKTVIPESKRFDKELSLCGGRTFFRSTLLPPPAKTLRGSNIDLLCDELCGLLKL